MWNRFIRKTLGNMFSYTSYDTILLRLPHSDRKCLKKSTCHIYTKQYEIHEVITLPTGHSSKTLHIHPKLYMSNARENSKISRQEFFAQTQLLCVVRLIIILHSQSSHNQNTIRVAFQSYWVKIFCSLILPCGVQPNTNLSKV